jgi:hypothetical protein
VGIDRREAGFYSTGRLKGVDPMRAAFLLLGLVVAAACVGLVVSFSSAVSAEPPQPKVRIDWKYKVVDLHWQTLSDTGKPLAALEDFGDTRGVQKRVEKLLNEHGRGGWELVSYSGGTAVYKRRVNQ